MARDIAKMGQLVLGKPVRFRHGPATVFGRCPAYGPRGVQPLGD